MATLFRHDGPQTREEQLANTWPVMTRSAALTDAQLCALRTESQRLRRPLTDAERDRVLNLTPAQKSGSARLVEVDCQ